MIIRATQQLLQLSGIPPVKNTNEPTLPFPGEWYANFVERFDGYLFKTGNKSMDFTTPEQILHELMLKL